MHNPYTITFFFGWDKKTSSIKFVDKSYILSIGWGRRYNVSLNNISDFDYDLDDILIIGENYRLSTDDYRKKIDKLRLVLESFYHLYRGETDRFNELSIGNRYSNRYSDHLSFVGKKSHDLPKILISVFCKNVIYYQRDEKIHYQLNTLVSRFMVECENDN